MTIKQIGVTILVVIVAFLAMMFLSKHQKQIRYTETAICKDKFPEFNENGLRGYYVIFEYQDGRVEEMSCKAKEYTRYDKNKQYVFTRTKYIWY